MAGGVLQLGDGAVCDRSAHGRDAGQWNGKAILRINDQLNLREVFVGLHTKVLDICYLIEGATAARKELVVRSWGQAPSRRGRFEAAGGLLDI